jgi:hypothetical protein
MSATSSARLHQQPLLIALELIVPSLSAVAECVRLRVDNYLLDKRRKNK